MKHIDYINLDSVNSADLLPLLNKARNRVHLIEHPLFDEESVRQWLAEKAEMDARPGCKIRIVRVDGKIAGWCGIQLEDGKYEIAIVIDDSVWGQGIKIFRDMMGWAKTLGHDTVHIHFLHTRPEYSFLKKVARRVYVSQLLGQTFTSYELEVS